MEPREKNELARIEAAQPPTPEASQLGPGTIAAHPKSMAAKIGRAVLQFLFPALILAAGFGAYNYLKATKPEPPKRTARPIVYSVQTLPIKFGNYEPSLVLYGTTIAGREVELRSLVSGKVERTGTQLQSGGVVKAGEMLLEIDPFNYRVALAEAEAQLAEAKAKVVETKASIAVENGNLKSAEIQLELAETDLKRAIPLAKQGTVSKRTLDDRRLLSVQRAQSVTQIQNNLRVWEARKDQQEAAIQRIATTVEQAQRRLKETQLQAPFDAYVTEVGAQIGRMLNVNDRVATLIDRNWIDARFNLTDQQFGRLTRAGGGLIGRKVEVKWNIGRKPLIYDAVIERIDGRVSSETGGVQVFARISNPHEDVAIRPGIFIEVRLSDAKFRQVAKVPAEAVYDAKTVYVVSDGKLVSRTIAIVGHVEGGLLIEGDVKDNEEVLMTRLSRPGDGVRVKERPDNGA